MTDDPIKKLMDEFAGAYFSAAYEQIEVASDEEKEAEADAAEKALRSFIDEIIEQRERYRRALERLQNFTPDDVRDLRAIAEDYSHPPTRDFLNSLADRIWSGL